MDIVIGVAPGQGRASTGLCAVEHNSRRIAGRYERHHVVHYAERLPPKTSYPALAQKLGDLLPKLNEFSAETISVAVDLTGVGEPVLHMLQEASTETRITGCYFTHGDRYSKEKWTVQIGKGYLVSKLQTQLQAGRLHMPRTPEAETVARELLDFEITVTKDANDRYGAFPVGSRDDLVTALGLAVCFQPPIPFRIY